MTILLNQNGFSKAREMFRRPAAAGSDFLRIPPFPGSKIGCFEGLEPAPKRSPAQVEELANALRRERVGGRFWAGCPPLPERRILARSIERKDVRKASPDGVETLHWPDPGAPARRGALEACDPWHALAGADAFIADSADDCDLWIARLLDIPCFVRGEDSQLHRYAPSLDEVIALCLPFESLVDPFGTGPLDVRRAIELCGFWRRLIESNRDLSGGLGFAAWKQRNVEPLLWNGSDEFRFHSSGASIRPEEGAVAVWRAKADPNDLARLEAQGTTLVEVEDGFLRSRGLGADCVPPLSITVDRLGVHFDPSGPSELEELIESGDFDSELLDRARELRALLVATGLGKYDCGGAPARRREPKREHILVPGQVEDDRSITTGGCGLESNLELLARVRSKAPQSFILYKPHPDVVAGHRVGEVDLQAALLHADEVVVDEPISSLIAMVDAVHVNTSLAGFEALLRGKQVVTHGLPFYAGWSLTEDLAPVPARRTARRSIDELVAATLLVYPRYLDPVSGLPCPAEIVAARLVGLAAPDGLLVRLRRFQGRLNRTLGKIRQ